MKHISIILMLLPLWVTPVIALQPFPYPEMRAAQPTAEPTAITPGQIERLINAIEQGTITANENLNGAVLVISIMLIIVVIIAVWRRREPAEVVNPALADVLKKYDKRFDDQQEIIAQQHETYEKFVGVFADISATQKYALSLLQKHEDSTINARERINAIEGLLDVMVNQGSHPLQDVKRVITVIEDRTRMMSETQLSKIEVVVGNIETHLVEVVTNIRQLHGEIGKQLIIRRTDTHSTIEGGNDGNT